MSTDILTLRDRLERALHRGNHRDMGGHLSDESDIITDQEALKEAAVLIAITNRADPGIILVQRPQYMRNHPGQIALPGGKIDPEDRDAETAALREAHEEVALEPSAVDVIGPVDRYTSGSGYNIQPILSVIAPDLPLKRDPVEVEDWFEAPLDFVLDPANAVQHEAQWNGRTRQYYEILWQDRRIWGITAGILVNLSRRLDWPL